MKTLIVFLFVFLFFLPLSTIAQSGVNPTLVGEINLGAGRANIVKAWGNDYIYGKTEGVNYFSTLGLVSRQGSTNWSHEFLYNSYFNQNCMSVVSDDFFVYTLKDTVYMVTRSGSVHKKVKIPSAYTGLHLFPGENGRHIAAEVDWSAPIIRWFVYDEDLNYLGVREGVNQGGIRRVIELNGFYYVASDQYGGGIHTNVSINFDKYDANGNLVWTTKIPDALRSDLTMSNGRLYFSCMFLRQSNPSVVTRYGELSLETGDTLWTRQWIATGFPMGVESSANPINSFPVSSGGFVITGSATRQGQNNPNVHDAFALVITPDGDIAWIIRHNQFGIFNAGDWNANRELVLVAGISSSKLFFYSIPGITGLDDEEEGSAPRDFSLAQNYPNPFNPSTTIKYSLPKSADVSIKVFDILGKEVAILANDYQEAGSHEIVFNASNIPSGVYIYQLRVGNFVSNKKMMLMK